MGPGSPTRTWSRLHEKAFDRALNSRPNQLHRLRGDVHVSAKDLLDVRIPGGATTQRGVESNVGVGIQYLESWLRGVGAAAISNLMEDTATAEIARSQVWQWVHHEVQLQDGSRLSRDRVKEILVQQHRRLRDSIGSDAFTRGKFEEARELFEEVALSDAFVEFLTIPASDRID